MTMDADTPGDDRNDPVPWPFGGPGPEPVSEETAASYRTRFAQLVREWTQECGAPPEGQAEPASFVRWLVGSRKLRCAPATWRHYRASVLHVLEEEGTQGALEAAGLLRSDTGQGAGTKVRRSKRKALPDGDLDKLNRALRASRSDFGRLTEAWLMAGLALGLRPIEVGTTREERNQTGGVVIVVRNAKATQGRGLGPERHLDLSPLREQDQRYFADFFWVMRGIHAEGTYETVYDSCRKILQTVCRRLWPKSRTNYTLYSGRHQFVANAKMAAPRKVVAAFLGHASDSTAPRHYGKRAQGRRAILPKVDAEAVARVRLTYRERKPRALKFEF